MMRSFPFSQNVQHSGQRELSLSDLAHVDGGLEFRGLDSVSSGGISNNGLHLGGSFGLAHPIPFGGGGADLHPGGPLTLGGLGNSFGPNGGGFHVEPLVHQTTPSTQPAEPIQGFHPSMPIGSLGGGHLVAPPGLAPTPSPVASPIGGFGGPGNALGGPNGGFPANPIGGLGAGAPITGPVAGLGGPPAPAMPPEPVAPVNGGGAVPPAGGAEPPTGGAQVVAPPLNGGGQITPEPTATIPGGTGEITNTPPTGELVLHTNSFEIRSWGDPHQNITIDGQTIAQIDTINGINELQTFENTVGGETSFSTETTGTSGATYNNEIEIQGGDWFMETIADGQGNMVATIRDENGTETLDVGETLTQEGTTFTNDNGRIVVTQQLTGGGQVSTDISLNGANYIDMVTTGTGDAGLGGWSAEQFVANNPTPVAAAPAPAPVVGTEVINEPAVVNDPAVAGA